MTRTRVFVAAVLLGAGLAALAAAQVAQPARPAAALRKPAGPASGPLWVNVLDFGARADNGATDNSGPFQAAIDRVSAIKGTWGTHGGVVYVPSSAETYGFYDSVFIDHDGITLQGDSRETANLVMMGMAAPVLIVGVRRSEPFLDGGTWKGIKPGPGNRVDLFGKLDFSAAPVARKRWGFRSRGNSFLQFQATPFTLGSKLKEEKNASEGWGDTSAFTLDLCCEPPLGEPFPVNAPLAGMGRVDPLEPGPFLLKVGNDPRTLSLLYRSASMVAEDPSRFDGFDFTLGNATPPYRIAVSVDLQAGRWEAYVNGRARPVTGVRTKATMGRIAAASGETFAPNRWEPWLVGALGERGPTGQPSSGIDLRVYGLRLSRVARYKADDKGRQYRVDTNRPPDDQWAYFGDDKDTVAFLPFDDPPSDSRIVPVVNGGAAYGNRSTGFLFHTKTPHGARNVVIKDLTIVGAGPYSYGVAVGAVIELHLERLHVRNAAYAIGSILRRDNYRIHLEDLHLEGFESGYFGYEQIIIADRIMFDYSGRNTIKLVGCGSRWRDVLVAFWSPGAEHTFEAIAIGYGGAHTLENFVIDFEGPTYRPGGAAVYCEAHPNRPATSLRLRDCFFGTLGKDVALIELKGAALANQNFAPGWFDAENVQAYTSQPGTLRIDGPLWRGSIRGLGAGKGVVIENSKRFGPETRITITEPR